MAQGTAFHLGATVVAALGLIGAGLVLWLEPQPPAQAVGSTRLGSALPLPRTGALPGLPAAAPVTPEAPTAEVAGASATPVTGGDPGVLFLAALKAAGESPQPPAPAGVANARSLPEAFEAMRAAQAEPRSANAGVSPFGGFAK